MNKFGYIRCMQRKSWSYTDMIDGRNYLVNALANDSKSSSSQRCIIIYNYIMYL